jgi:Uma2 family endonuclease
MNIRVPRSRHMTVEQYLALESESPRRHEYLASEVFQKISGTPRHDAIATRLLAATRSHLERTPWQTFMSDTRVRVKALMREYFYYPDLMVIHSPAWRAEGGERARFVSSPTLIVEVVSPATENVDRREKAQMYRAIPTLEEYVLIAEEESEVTIHRRSESWQPATYSALEEVAEFRSIGLSLALGQIYEDAPSTK